MPITSAGVMAYRVHDGVVQVLLAHPGGPFAVRKDEGAWSIPKGILEGDESAERAARREFAEETGAQPPSEMVDLGVVRQSGAKYVHAFAARMDVDPATITSNTFELEWPPHSGMIAEYPEVDRVDWFALDEARAKIIKGQRPLLDRLAWLLEQGASAQTEGTGESHYTS